MSKFAVMLYPDFSLQEITCLTSVLSVWFGEKIDFISSGAQEVTSEEGLKARPTKTTAEAKVTDYDCVILPGTVNPLPALFDDELIRFLGEGAGSETVFAAISSAPILLSKAGDPSRQEVHVRLFYADGGNLRFCGEGELYP